MSSEDLKIFNVVNGQIVMVKTESGIILDNVKVKSDDSCVLEFHMNKDEAEDLEIETGMSVTIC